MKYYSEKTEKMYDTVEDLEKAEAVLKMEQLKEQTKKAAEAARKKKLAEERDERRKAVTEAYDAAYDAYKKAAELAKEYTNDYGSFKYERKDKGSPFDLDWYNAICQMLKAR